MSYTIGHEKAIKLIRSINAERIVIISCRPDLIPIKELSKSCTKGFSKISSEDEIIDPGIYFGCIKNAGSLYEHLYENAGWFVLIMWVYNDLPQDELIIQGNLYDTYAGTFSNKFITVLAESR